jgi:predicted HTH domain antitoxin
LDGLRHETERLSLGKAAELAGYSVRAFMEILAHYGVPLCRYDPDELEREVQQWSSE